MPCGKKIKINICLGLTMGSSIGAVKSGFAKHCVGGRVWMERGI